MVDSGSSGISLVVYVVTVRPGDTPPLSMQLLSLFLSRER